MNRICTILRQEFRWRNLWFSDVHPKRFATFQWRVPHIVVLIYRLIHAVYVDFWLIYTASKTKQGEDIPLPWASYLTNWTYCILCAYSTLHLLVALFETECSSMSLHHRRSTEEHNLLFTEHHSDSSLWTSGEYLPISSDEEDGIQTHTLSWYSKIVWILYNIISSCALMVTLVFFVFLWPDMKTKFGVLDLFNTQLHAINTVLVVLEHLLSAVPIRLLHYVYPLIFGVIYVIFSAIYWGVDHDNVLYPGVLDWNNPGKTTGMLFLVALVILPLFHIGFFILHRIKLCIHCRVSEESL